MSIKQLIVRINECSYFFHRDGNYSFFFCLFDKQWLKWELFWSRQAEEKMKEKDEVGPFNGPREKKVERWGSFFLRLFISCENGFRLRCRIGERVDGNDLSKR